MATPYIYQPLPPGKIRLLKLHSPTSATLFASTLNDNYTALSYCWGSSIQSETMLIDGKALAITSTLKSALERVSGTIWIDQICINQEDDEEKSHQVRMMGEIYRCAKTTFVDLGRDEHNLGPLLEALGQSLYAEIPFLQVDRSKHHEVMKFIYEAGYEDHDTTLIRLINFGSHPYFKRIWVAQECAMAGKDRLLFLIGRHRLPWKAVLASWRIMQHTEPGSMTPTDTGDLFNASDAGRLVFFQGLLNEELEDYILGKPLSHIVWYVNLCGGMQCTDPRDQLYAIHSLASDRQHLPLIDYSKTNLEVRLEHTIYLLEQSDGFLDRITCTFAYQDASLPSWCLKDGQGEVAVLRANNDNAGYFLPEIYKVREQCLNVVGLVIDTVVNIEKHEATPLKIVLESGWNLARHLQDLYSLHYRGDPQAAGKAALRSLRALYLPCLRLSESVSQLGENVDIWQPRAHKRWEQTFLEGCHGAKLTVYNAGYTFRHCRIVVTSHGRSGLAYKETAAADTIAIIAGVSQPVVLRARGDSYRLLWKARIDGLLNGEMLDNDHALMTALHPGIWLC